MPTSPSPDSGADLPSHLDEPYDAIVVLELWGGRRGPAAVLGSLLPGLRDGGCVIVGAPNPRSQQVLLELVSTEPAVESSLPGQFYLLGVGPRDPFPRDPLLLRPMSVLSADSGQLRFLFKIAGRGTRELAKLECGDGLCGVEVCRRCDHHQVEFFGGEQGLGTGIPCCAERGVCLVQACL